MLLLLFHVCFKPLRQAFVFIVGFKFLSEWLYKVLFLSNKNNMEVYKIRFAGGTTQVPKEERLAQKTCPRNLVSILHGRLMETMCSQMALLSPHENVDSLVFIYGWGLELWICKAFTGWVLLMAFSLTCHILLQHIVTYCHYKIKNPYRI